MGKTRLEELEDLDRAYGELIGCVHNNVLTAAPRLINKLIQEEKEKGAK